MLNIVNDNDEIIGQDTRENIHKNGLLHRETNIYFITPNREIIFQHRAKDKDTYPDLLDATVGGHVEIRDSYEQTAIKETAEETGVKIEPSDLILINKIKKYSEDKATNKINHVFNTRYAYIYKGDVNDLRIEPGKALGFEVWPIDRLLNLSESDKIRFIPYILKFSTTELADFINNHIAKQKFVQIISRICRRDTSADPEHWGEKNPLWGHCAVVSLLAQDQFGGSLIRQSLEGVPGLEYLRSHYINRLPDGEEIDFTIEQFQGRPLALLPAEERTRERILSYPDTARRYEILKSRFQSEYLKIFGS